MPGRVFGRKTGSTLSRTRPRQCACLSHVPISINPQNDDECCRPGDITVSQIPFGYLLGRVLPGLGPGPWWEYIGISEDFPGAAQRAHALAKLAGVRVWRHTEGDNYERLTEGASR